MGSDPEKINPYHKSDGSHNHNYLITKEYDNIVAIQNTPMHHIVKLKVLLMKEYGKQLDLNGSVSRLQIDKKGVISIYQHNFELISNCLKEVLISLRKIKENPQRSFQTSVLMGLVYGKEYIIIFIEVILRTVL